MVSTVKETVAQKYILEVYGRQQAKRGELVLLWDVGMPEKLIRADVLRGSSSLQRSGLGGAWRQGYDQCSLEHCYRGHLGRRHLSIAHSFMWLRRRVCMKEWKDMMLQSQGRLNIILKVFKWLININQIRGRLSDKQEEARFQVGGSICI